MSKSIWHRYDEAPKHQDIIITDTGYWAYRADLLALETENKDLSDKIGKLETELEQSENCCSAWEKQALDYKAENIALSGELERTRKAIECAKDALKYYSDKPGNWLYGEFQGDYDETPGEVADRALNQINNTEQKDVK